MKIGFTALATAITAATSAVAQITSGYVLNAAPLDKTGPGFTSPFTTVSFWKGQLYIGMAKFDSTSELFTFTKLAPVSTPGMIAFTSYHESPTGWQNMYVFPKSFAAPGFTSPHSASIPPGADAFNFTLKADNFLRYRDTDGWYACPDPSTANTYQIFYYDSCLGTSPAPNSTCIATTLQASLYGQC